MKLHTYDRAHDIAIPIQRKPFLLLTILLTLIVAVSLSGCVGVAGAGTPAKTSNSSSSGTLAANATSFSFGNVAVGSNAAQTLTLTNTGTATITVSGASVTGTGFSVVGGSTSVSIAAGQNHSFQIQFAPQAVGPVTGSISVISNATNSTLGVSLSGTGISSLSITTQPANQSVTSGQTANFTVAATGGGTLTYQWKGNGTPIVGATSSSYTSPNTTVSDNGKQFMVAVTDSNGIVMSNNATLTVTASPVAPSITTQPASQSITAGQTATFSVAANGSATLAYQWKKNGTPISGATAALYTTPATTTSDNSALFTVTVTNSAGSVTSNAATLTVNAATFVLNSSKTSLSYSSFNIGSTSNQSVTFSNTGNSNVTVSNVSISGAGFTASGVSSGLILTPGQSTTLIVSFTPSSTTSVTGSVTVTSNAKNSPATISLSGTGVQQVSHSVTLNWTASTSTVSGYDVYRSTVSSGSYAKVNSSLDTTTSYVDSSVQAGQMYFYVATSVNSSSVESAFSTEVSATIPTP